ncbi:MAG: hypothetical protein JW969_00025 [Spirochaetales bacterium]|nr:hypothetical protein [Spirochaetales bacterium]
MTAIPKDMEPLLDQKLLKWLLEGDVSIQFQVHRDLLDSRPIILSTLQNRIPNEGFGKRFLNYRDPKTGLWPGWYGPKWISNHYTLLELMNIGFPGKHPEIKEITAKYVNGIWGEGAFNKKSRRWFDTCVAAMLISLACHAGLKDTADTCKDIVDYLLKVLMPDGGWNCGWWRIPGTPVKSSVHTTISVLEALRDLLVFRNAKNQPFSHRLKDRKAAMASGAELLLKRRVYMKLSVDEAIEPRFTRMSFPCRWRFDFLRALDWFASVKWKPDTRLTNALSLLKSRRRKDGTWPVQEKHAGLAHFSMEETGRPSRWNTLRALRVLRHFKTMDD